MADNVATSEGGDRGDNSDGTTVSLTATEVASSQQVAATDNTAKNDASIICNRFVAVIDLTCLLHAGQYYHQLHAGAVWKSQ
jgi:hypothetical protein